MLYLLVIYSFTLVIIYALIYAYVPKKNQTITYLGIINLIFLFFLVLSYYETGNILDVILGYKFSFILTIAYNSFFLLGRKKFPQYTELVLTAFFTSFVIYIVFIIELYYMVMSSFAFM